MIAQFRLARGRGPAVHPQAVRNVGRPVVVAAAPPAALASSSPDGIRPRPAAPTTPLGPATSHGMGTALAGFAVKIATERTGTAVALR
ncbi:hypothetical protein San01_60840 [Streptomyces angustmyceticus]|uniref:Uncharacterized protein n=1 Tax=Streptomyces angustmyceticus TaxID=285578 RepID=A0A5J4LPW2_9ACTN|nr:hypothetical protein San01_60840 [Streptomyces angustmyceticus]